MSYHRPIAGQLSLIEGEPPVAYCRGCRRRLRGRHSIERGFGETCWRVHQGKAERTHFCAVCDEPLDLAAEPGCSSCGNGYETRRTRIRTVIKPTQPKGHSDAQDSADSAKRRSRRRTKRRGTRKKTTRRKAAARAREDRPG